MHIGDLHVPEQLDARADRPAGDVDELLGGHEAPVEVEP